MLKFEINPYVGVDDVFFDMTREAVRKILGQYKEFKKTPASKNTTDDFNFCHVFYDLNNKAEAVEFFAGNGLIFKETDLFSMDYKGLLQFIKTHSTNYSEDDSGVIINDLGFAVYAPDKNTIETILVFRKGYYD